MDPRKKCESFDFTDSLSIDTVLSANSVHFFLKFKAFELTNVISLKEYIYISPYIDRNDFGEHSISSLFRDIINNNNDTFTVSDYIGEEYFYKKLSLESEYYSCSSNEYLSLSENNYIFKTKDNYIFKYQNGNNYPSNIYKNEISNNGLNYSFSYSNNKISSITSNRTNTIVEYIYSSNTINNIFLKKNLTTYETIRIEHNTNNQITRICRIRSGDFLEDISFIHGDGQIEVVDNKTTKRIKIQYSQNDLLSITSGRNNTRIYR